MTTRMSGAVRSGGGGRGGPRPTGGRRRRLAGSLYTVGLVLSAVVGALHFLAPYAFAWSSYIPDAPREILVSIHYINFLFALMLTGLSVILLTFRRRAFDGSTEVLTLLLFLVLVWMCRVVLAVVLPWPTSLNTWLLVGVVAVFVTLLLPALYLCSSAASTPARAWIRVVGNTGTGRSGSSGSMRSSISVRSTEPRMTRAECNPPSRAATSALISR